MSDYVLYSKPLVVTEEKLKAAREKQMKQRALKEALDRQVEQTKVRKQTNKAFEKNNDENRKNGIKQRPVFGAKNVHSNFVGRDDDDNNSLGLCVVPRTMTTTTTTTTTTPPKSTLADVSLFRRVLADPVPSTGPVYNTNSLPPNFAMSVSEENPLVPKRGEYNTNSLPTAFLCGNAKSNDTKNVSMGVRELFSGGGLQKCSPEINVLSSEADYQTNRLSRFLGLEDVKKQLPLQQQQQQQQQLQSVAPTLLAVKGLSGVMPPALVRSNVAHRHPGGLLPPLEPLDAVGGRRVSRETTPERGPRGTPPMDVAAGAGGKNGRQIKLKQPSAPRGRSNEVRARPVPGGAGGPRGGPTRVAVNKMEQLQKELKFRDVEMARMREKERNWEEQVKQLKIELKSAKKKERDLNRLVKEGPRRAETAPDQPIVSAPVLGSPGQAGKKGVGTPSTCALGKKQKFANGCVFRQEAFRPISAPSEPVVTSYVPPQRDVLPAMQESFKLASVLTRKTAFGLPEEHANRPVPIEYEHLLQFVKEQIITQQQAEALWRLFTNEDSPLALLHRQPVNFPPLEKAVVASGGSSFNVEGVKHDECRDAIVEESNDKSNEAEISYVELEEREEEEDRSDERSNKEPEQVDDTFETFAELHLNGYLSQEETEDD